MKKNNRLINTRGEIVGLVDDSGIVPDGFGIRVPMTLQDGVPIAAETSLQITDAWGNAAGHRPGYVFNRDSEVQAQDATNAREAYKARLSNAWRTGKAESKTLPPAPRHWARPAPDAWGGPWENQNPNPKPPDVTMDADHARETYKARLQDAWKTKPATVVSEPTQHTSDAAPSSAAAHAALVRRTENAWRTGGTR